MGGDGTQAYKVTDYKSQTVGEFVDEVIKQSEWGEITVKGKGFFSKRINYKNGHAEPFPEEWEHMKIESVNANGGWGCMNYKITPKTEETAEPCEDELQLMSLEKLRELRNHIIEEMDRIDDQVTKEKRAYTDEEIKRWVNLSEKEKCIFQLIEKKIDMKKQLDEPTPCMLAIQLNDELNLYREISQYDKQLIIKYQNLVTKLVMRAKGENFFAIKEDLDEIEEVFRKADACIKKYQDKQP